MEFNSKDYIYTIKGVDGEKEYEEEVFYKCLLEVTAFTSKDEFTKEVDNTLEPFIDERGIQYPASYIIERDEPEQYAEQYSSYIQNKYIDLCGRLNNGEAVTLNNTEFKVTKK